MEIAIIMISLIMCYTILSVVADMCGTRVVKVAMFGVAVCEICMAAVMIRG